MSLTLTDLFCGAGGSSLGASAVAHVELVMAANHWSTAIEVHQSHFPQARHDLADISQADPRRYPRTNILLASPECTNHSQARGVSRRQQQPDLFGDFDAAAERSRATMWDVGRFAEQLHYDAIIVENVVEASAWSGWTHWLGWLTDLGYHHRVISANSMHHGVPQSRDRIYVVLWRKGLRPDLEMEVTGWCQRCQSWRPARQAFKPQRTLGRYRQQWIWSCVGCGRDVHTVTEPAASIIDWQLPCPRIGDRKHPLAAATRARILAGLQRYGWVPVTTSGAGNVWESTPGMRARPLTDPLPTQQTTSTTALAAPPGFLVQTAHGSRLVPLDAPHPTVCGSDDRHSLVTAPFLISQRDGTDRRVHPISDPLGTCTSSGNNHALVVPMQNHGEPQSTSEPLHTVRAGGFHHGLLMRNNRGGAEMVTPLTEPARSMTAKAPQSLLVPYNRTGHAKPVTEPAPTMLSKDTCGLLDVEAVIDDCGFRMLEPHEIAAAMAFPEGYIPDSYSKKDRIRLAGNAVTPPVMTWLVGRVVRALEEAT